MQAAQREASRHGVWPAPRRVAGAGVFPAWSVACTVMIGLSGVENCGELQQTSRSRRLYPSSGAEFLAVGGLGGMRHYGWPWLRATVGGFEEGELVAEGGRGSPFCRRCAPLAARTGCASISASLPVSKIHLCLGKRLHLTSSPALLDVCRLIKKSHSGASEACLSSLIRV